jgi:hypothetical protein
MNIGPLTITGEFDSRDTDIVEDLLDLPWPWHLLDRLDGPEVAFLDRARPGVSGIIRGNTAEIWGQFQDDSRVRSTRWAVHHEIGHLLDKATYNPSLTENRRHLRDDLHRLMHPDSSHDHLTTERPPPAGTHSWSSDGTPERWNAPAEAFAEWFAWATGTHLRMSHGHHSWVYTAADIDETFRRHAEGDDVPEPAFTDTDDPDILEAARLGLVQGYEDGTYRPEQPLTRRQAAYLALNLHRALH